MIAGLIFCVGLLPAILLTAITGFVGKLFSALLFAPLAICSLGLYLFSLLTTQFRHANGCAYVPVHNDNDSRVDSSVSLTIIRKSAQNNVKRPYEDLPDVIDQLEPYLKPSAARSSIGVDSSVSLTIIRKSAQNNVKRPYEDLPDVIDQLEPYLKPSAARSSIGGSVDHIEGFGITTDELV
ncbi:hypothetical protein ADUPG1_013277 [Aduncisulcus paluster]|uniref:Uncharacterized protein n=1 Tax=Aduncisulcus paluster TaxID=2918883 RepID=A0ABQ5K5L5_9EUKA|nr:hypothetical protein ADUPG1_013277 [Aduncisulcus paluster]